jgi:hypothetical protein
MTLLRLALGLKCSVSDVFDAISKSCFPKQSERLARPKSSRF